MALLLAACGSSGHPNGATSSPTTSAVATPTMTPVTRDPKVPPVPFRDYLSSIGVTGVPARFDDTPGLKVTVPIPDGWTRTGDPLFATGVDFVQPLDGNGTYPSSTLMAILLEGNFDPKEAVRHANGDALPPTSTGITESFDDYQGFPSAAAEGIAGGSQHYSRILIATVPSSGKRYLVQLTATTLADKPIAQSPALSSVISGLKVEVS
jgi:hypothetical protein